jgi:ketosteroid isomerase-like protein
MEQEERAVAEANESFYRAFESLDINEMQNIWSRESAVQCGHPGWRILRGWDAVMESWRRIFENTPAIRFLLTHVSIEMRGNMAWVTLYENLRSSVEGQEVSAIVLSTNIFEKGADGWRMILHHGSSVAQPTPADDPQTVH